MKTWTILMNPDEEILQMMKDARWIYDQALYYQRQKFFETRKEGKIKTFSFKELYHIVSQTDEYKSMRLDSVSKSGALRQLFSNWNGYIRSVMQYKKHPEKFLKRPKLPNYICRRSEFNLVQIDKTRFCSKGCRKNEIRLPKSNVKIAIPERIERKSIREITIKYYHGKIKVGIVFDEYGEKIKYDCDKNLSVGVDIGLNNLMAITSNDKSFSYVVNGRPLKSINQFYNKQKSFMRSNLDKCNKKSKISKRLKKLEIKRTEKISHYLHCVSKQIIELCVSHGVSKIIIGHNKSWKQNINLGKQTNQNFVSVPFNRLISQIVDKARKYEGLEVKIVEESYTSKADHLSLEKMTHQDCHKGKRIKRGLFKSSCGKIINADINGAVGILRKGKAITDEQLMFLRDRGDVVSPKVFKLNL